MVAESSVAHGLKSWSRKTQLFNKENIDAQMFNLIQFCPKINRKWRDFKIQIFNSILVFLDENFRTRRKFSDKLKFRGGAVNASPPHTTPLVEKTIQCSTAQQREVQHTA